jgi:DNA modification methylase
VKAYFEGDGVTLWHGDNMAVLPQLAGESFDACITDPPYGLAFMGKDWDYGVPDSRTWVEVLRVLKPGAPLLAFGGTRTFHRLACAIEDAGFALSDTLCWLHGQGFPKGHSQLKPAWEPITLAWKKGPRVLAIDAARIGTTKNVPASLSKHAKGFVRNGSGGSLGFDANLGRWPANVLLDAEAAAMVDAQTGTLTTHGGGTSSFGGSFGSGKPVTDNTAGERFRGDSGGPSRFFYCAKASKSERGEGNAHPTVKPLDLMRWLCKLVCPPDGGVLIDPFMGSGSTIVAGRNFFRHSVGIDLDAEKCAAAKRLAQGVLDFPAEKALC